MPKGLKFNIIIQIMMVVKHSFIQSVLVNPKVQLFGNLIVNELSLQQPGSVSWHVDRERGIGFRYFKVGSDLPP